MPAAEVTIRNLRLYFAYTLPANLFYLNRYAALVARLLAEKNFQCPGYHHLCISIAGTREIALKHALVVEDWYTFGVAVLEEKALKNAGFDEQQSLVLQAIKEGLLVIAERDGLDKAIINDAIEEAGKIGVQEEILFKAMTLPR